MKITKNQFNMMKHALGLNYKETSFRNHYVSSKTGKDFDEWQYLVKNCLAVEMKSSLIGYHFVCFQVTERGREIVKILIQKTKPKLTRSQKRYKAYLKSDTEETFIDWLRNPYWDDYRKRAMQN
jgi:hypothetical protein